MSPSVPGSLRQARQSFGALVEDLRPHLHRYCTRMVGSVIDGEDVVQETLAKAYYALSTMPEVPNLRPWLFRIAHNKAIDYLRATARRGEELVDAGAVPAAEEAPPLERREDAALAMSFYLELTPMQRSCVILKDVLGCSLAETAGILDTSVAAIKGALHRGRSRLRLLAGDAGAVAAVPPPMTDPARLTLLQRYVDSFNARDWDTLRQMLADDARLDLLDRTYRTGREQVGDYFTNYGKIDGWQLALGTVEGRHAIIVHDHGGDARRSHYFILVDFDDAGKVATIRDYRYVSFLDWQAPDRRPASG